MAVVVAAGVVAAVVVVVLVAVAVDVVVVAVGGNQIYRWDLNTGMERPSWVRPQKNLS